MKPYVYTCTADLLVALHLAYVAFVILGQVAILAGWAAGWGWIRNFWFRVLHLAAIGGVALEAVFGITCPLTAWEHGLRRLAGQRPEEISFIGRLLREILFVDVPQETLNLVYVVFALLVLATFVWIPPRRPRKHGSVHRPAALE